MKTGTNRIAAGLMFAVAGSALAATHYVDLNSPNSISPYTNWSTAAKVIQDAVDAAAAGDEVIVTNGTFADLEWPPRDTPFCVFCAAYR